MKIFEEFIVSQEEYEKNSLLPLTGYFKTIDEWLTIRLSPEDLTEAIATFPDVYMLLVPYLDKYIKIEYMGINVKVTIYEKD